MGNTAFPLPFTSAPFTMPRNSPVIPTEANMFTRIACLALALALLSGLTGQRLKADDPPNKPPANAEFEGRYLDVILKTPTVINGLSYSTHYPLQKVQKKALGDQWFLVGEGIDASGQQKWYAGATIWLALTDISAIHSFPTLEKLKSSLVQ